MAARFRKIDPRIWTDEKFRQLTGEQQRIALYILTAQSNRIGLFSFSPGKACEDLGTLPPTFLKGLLKVCQTLNWEWDAKARVLYLPTWWRYNHPENVNNVIGNLKDLDDLPETSLLERFSTNTICLSECLVETFTQTLSKRSPQRFLKRSPSQEQEPEQKQEQKLPPTPQGEMERIVEFWNLIPGVVKMQSVQGPIRTRLLARCREHPSPLWWDELFHRVQRSDFLTGKKTDFAASLDWVLGPKNLAKLLAGNYENRSKLSGSSKPKSLVELL